MLNWKRIDIPLKQLLFYLNHLLFIISKLNIRNFLLNNFNDYLKIGKKIIIVIIIIERI